MYLSIFSIKESYLTETQRLISCINDNGAHTVGLKTAFIAASFASSKWRTGPTGPSSIFLYFGLIQPVPLLAEKSRELFNRERGPPQPRRDKSSRLKG